MKTTNKLSISLLAIVSICCSISSSSYAATILLIESYHAEYDWDACYIKAIKEQLSSHTIKIFEMDTKRLPQSMHQEKANEAWKKINEIKPDYVILGDDNALKYLGKRLSKTNIPTVFMGINHNPRDYFESKMLPRNMTGIIERPLVNRAIVDIQKIIPTVKKILILFDDGITSNATITPEMKTGRLVNIAVEYRQIGTQTGWEKSIQNAKKQGFDAILIGLYHTITNDEGKHVAAEDIMSWTNQHSELPLFALWKFSVGKGKTSGGIVLDGYQMGKAAAQITEDVISGKNPLVRINTKGLPMFSKYELNRWNLKLPETLRKSSILVE